MAEYRAALIRNGFIAIIISCLIIGVAYYSSGLLADHIQTNLTASTSSPTIHTTSIGSSSSTITTTGPSGSVSIITTTIASSSQDSITSTSTPESTSTSSASSSFSSTTSPFASSSSTGSTSASSSYTTSSTNVGNVTIVAFENSTNTCCAVYDSVNGLVYAQTANSLVLIHNGSAIASIAGNFASVPYSLTVNTRNGTVVGVNPSFVAHNGCSFPSLSQINNGNTSGPSFFFTQGLTGPLSYDSSNNYTYFASGGLGAEGPCPVGLTLLNSSSQVSFVPTGPQPARQNSSTYETIPAIALSPVDGRLFVPVVNVTTSLYNASNVNLHTTIYTVLGHAVQNSSTFSLPGQTVQMAYDPSNSYLYSEQLSNASYDSQSHVVGGSYQLYAINTAVNISTYATSGAIPLSANSPLVYDSANHKVYVFEQNQILLLSGSNVEDAYLENTNSPVSAATFDPSNNELIEFNTPGQSSGATTTTTTTNAYSTTTSSSSSSSTQLPPANTVTTIAAALSGSFAFDPYSKILYAPASNASTILEINGSSNSLLGGIKFSCGSVGDVAFDTKDNLLFALFTGKNPSDCSNTNGTLVAINPSDHSIAASSSLVANPLHLAYDSKDNTLFIEGSNTTLHSLFVVDAATQSVLKQIIPINYNNLLWGPMLYDPVNDFLYFEWSTPGANNNYFAGSIVNASSNTIIGSFDPFSGDMPPSSLTYNPINGLVYVAQAGSGGCLGYNNCMYSAGNNVTVLNGTRVQAPSIAVASNPNGSLKSVAFSQTHAGPYLYLLNGSISSTLTTLTALNIGSSGGGAFVTNIYGISAPVSSLYVDPANSSTLYLVSNELYVLRLGN